MHKGISSDISWCGRSGTHPVHAAARPQWGGRPSSMDGSGSVSAATCQHTPCCLARLTVAMQQHDILSIVGHVLHCVCCLDESWRLWAPVTWDAGMMEHTHRAQSTHLKCMALPSCPEPLHHAAGGVLGCSRAAEVADSACRRNTTHQGARASTPRGWTIHGRDQASRHGGL